MKTPILFALPMLALAGCQTMDETPSEKIGTAVVQTAAGKPAGTAQLYSNGTEVTIAIGLVGMAPGVHGTHLHTTGACTPPDFTSAGGHLNPGHKQHGTENPAGAHLGDLPNVTIGSNGAGSASATLRGTPAEVMADIFDTDGTAIVVHEGADDYMTDPSGASGGRIACGVFTRG